MSEREDQVEAFLDACHQLGKDIGRSFSEAVKAFQKAVEPTEPQESGPETADGLPEDYPRAPTYDEVRKAMDFTDAVGIKKGPYVSGSYGATFRKRTLQTHLDTHQRRLADEIKGYAMARNRNPVAIAVGAHWEDDVIRYLGLPVVQLPEIAVPTLLMRYTP